MEITFNTLSRLSSWNRFLLLRRALVSLAVLVFAISFSNATSAAFIVLTDRTAFLGATTSSTHINFADAYSPNASFLSNYSGPSGLTIGGVNFVGSNYLVVVAPGNAPQFQGWAGDPVVLEFGGGPGSTYPGYLDITFAPGTTAIGSDLYAVRTGTTGQFGGDVRITLSSGDSFVIKTPATRPTLGFFGILADSPVTGMRVEGVGAYYPELSNFVVGAAKTLTPVPEPTSAIIFGIGSVLVVLRRNRIARLN